MRPPWYDRAACATRDFRLFYSQVDDVRKNLDAERRRVAHAKEVCNACPVTGECLEYALAKPERYGIWGGTDRAERDWLRKRLSHQERVLGLVGGMKKAPDGIHRRAVGTKRPAQWYDIWLTQEDRCVLIGHSKRHTRHLTHRVYSVVRGVQPQLIVGWVAGVSWLKEQWESYDKTSDHCHAVEEEAVRIA